MSDHDGDVMLEEVVPAASPDDEDESNGNGHHLPNACPIWSTQTEVVHAVNALAVELQMTRQAVSRIGTRMVHNELALEERLEAFEILLKRAIASRKGGE
jgi:hypothetical protein